MNMEKKIQEYKNHKNAFCSSINIYSKHHHFLMLGSDSIVDETMKIRVYHRVMNIINKQNKNGEK